MKKLTWLDIQKKRRLLPLALGFSLVLGACHVPLATTGSLRFQLAVPQSAAATHFALQAIPAGTDAFEIQISGQGLASPLVRRFDIAQGSSQTQTISGLPLGPKTVRVQALAQEQVLAGATQSVEIKAGELGRVELELKALIQQVQVILDTPLPLDFELDLTIRGEGLNENFQKKFNLKAGQTQLEIGALPPGEKEARIIFRTQAEGKDVFSETLIETFEVSEQGEGILRLGVENILASYSSQLEVLLDRLPVLQVLAILGQLNPEQLRRFLERLPKALRERLLVIPQIRARLGDLATGFVDNSSGQIRVDTQPIATASPSPLLTSSPDPTPSPEPSLKPITVVTKTLTADVRLAFQKPENPNLLMASEPIERDNSLPLSAGQTQVVAGGKIWGLLIRTDDLLPVIAYTLHLNTAGIEGEGLLLGREPRELNQFFVYQGVRYRGGIIPFRLTDQPIELEPGQSYRLTLNLTHPETNQQEIRVYRIKAADN